MATQIEETLKRIQTSDGVTGFVIINSVGMISACSSCRQVTKNTKNINNYIILRSIGIPIKSNLDDAMAVRYAGLVQQLIATSMVVIKKGDPTDKLTYFRLRTKHNEIIVIPGILLVKLVVCCG